MEDHQSLIINQFSTIFLNNTTPSARLLTLPVLASATEVLENA
jgi:hypothetical protein